MTDRTHFYDRTRRVVVATVAFVCLGCSPSVDHVQSISPSAPVPVRRTVSRIATEVRAMRGETSQAKNQTVFNVADAGIEFTYENGTNGRRLMVESTGGGAGWIDYDSDGWRDLYFPQGGNPTPENLKEQPIDRLFRNLGDGRFQDVTYGTGIEDHAYGQGAAVADYDNDGFEDLFVTNVGVNVLYRNMGDGTFLPVEFPSRKDKPLWSTSAGWGDIDRDGDLDLYVNTYCDYDPYHPKPCPRADGGPGTCHPKEVEPLPDEFYLNEGDGTFRNVAQERGLFGPGNRGLGVAIADFDNDDWPDIFVANDTTMNFLFINQKNGTFSQMSEFLGCAVNVNGSPQANMGIAVGDYDGNGYLDLYVTHFHSEWNTLYQNLGPQGFHDVTAQMKLATTTMDKLAFGTVMADFDQNGLMELIVANGHIDDVRDKGIDFEMNPQLFAYNGKTWDETTNEAGPFFQEKTLGRGIASADYDADGDLDVVYVSQNAKTVLLRNDSRRGHWLKIKFLCKTSNRFGIGTRVTLRCGSKTWMQELAGGTSYCSSHEPTLIFGLGNLNQDCSLEIRWPNGSVSSRSHVQVDSTVTLREE